MTDDLRKFSDFIEGLETTDGEQADALVCRLLTDPLQMPDNLVSSCTKCHRLIQHRPHAPKKPIKICDECALRNMAPDAKFVITENSRNDLRGLIRKKMN